MAKPAHTPVLLNETVEELQVRPGGRYIDCTLGAGGHAEAILQNCMPGGRLLGIDADPTALQLAAERLRPYAESLLLVNDNFNNLQVICIKHDFMPVHGILFDLGLSSMQLETGAGFSFQHDAPLDMRFNPTQDLTAADIVNTWGQEELIKIIKDYGEEKQANRIVRAIVANRPFHTSLELASLIERATGGKRGKIHPATRTFQALRITVNHELEYLEAALKQSVSILAVGGRLVVISYHSLEDRIVKQFMQREAKNCICPPGTLTCVCGHKATLRLVHRKVLTPSSNETRANPRSRSAKMRVAERIISEEEPIENLDRAENDRSWKRRGFFRKLDGVLDRAPTGFGRFV